MPRLMPALVGATLIVSVAVIAGVLVFTSSPDQNGVGVPTEAPGTATANPASTPSPFVTSPPTEAPGTATASPASTPSASAQVVRGWPSTRHNPPGVYAWEGTTCAGPTCVFGFMHNGYGSGDVEIRIEVVPEPTNSDDGASAVTVAGHEASYRRIDARREEWIVDIRRTSVSIRLTARPDASQADLDEAHAIIGSMRYERQDNDLGFRLVFTITTDDWDSG